LKLINLIKGKENNGKGISRSVTIEVSDKLIDAYKVWKAEEKNITAVKAMELSGLSKAIAVALWVQSCIVFILNG
jgi:hypothetical protein